MSSVQSLVEAHATEFASQLTQAFLSNLRSMTINDLIALTHGGAPRGQASTPAAAVAAAPARRGPGRPKKAASAPAATGKKNKKAASAKKSGRLARRSAGDIESALSNVVSLLGSHASGLRSEQIRDALGVDKKELPRVLAEGLSSNALVKTGEKRGTLYFARSGKKR